MTRRRTLLSVEDREVTDFETAEEAEIEEPVVLDTPVEDEGGGYLAEDYEDESSRPRGTWVVPTLAVLAILGWTGFFGWVNQEAMLAGASPAQWSQWITAWSMPVLLVIGVWMLAMRNSRREANRFADAARSLREESSQLEARLSVVNRELSLARDFLASQSRDLESLGRVATERLSTNADRLQSLIHDNSAQLDNIGTVSGTALSNMENLRDQLPVLSNAARDMSNQIGNAGNIAQSQVESLVEAFDRLNQFGEVGQGHVERVKETVSDTLDAFDRQVASIGEVTQARFRKLREISDAFRNDLVDSEDTAFAAIHKRAEELTLQITTQTNAQQELEDDAIAAMRERIAQVTSEGNQLLSSMGEGREEAFSAWTEVISGLEARMAAAVAQITSLDNTAMESARARFAALSEEAGRLEERFAASGNAFDEEVERRRAENAARNEEELHALEGRLAELDQRIAERQEEHVAHVTGLAERGEALAQRLAALDAEIARLGTQSSETGNQLSDAAQLLADRVSQSRAILEESGSFIGDLTSDSVRLLEIIRSTADHSQGALSNAVGSAEARLSSFGEEAQRLQELIQEAEERGERLGQHVGSANTGAETSLENLRAMEARLATLAEESERLATHTGEELRGALEQLGNSSAAALEELRANQSEVVDEIAGRIAAESREKIAETIREEAATTINELEQAIVRAAESGRDTTVDLRNQLARLNELTGNLEQRITYARERAEEKIDSDFSRRMALITESLNSSAIDISKAFDNEVSDTQWAHYLKGDRGIFTRRAVRLLDKHETRAVAEIYGEDREFRETVNRFIHDFEAMLREVLSTRDGNAMAVTLLSSDMGKLYVALAQAIDRLRN